MKSNAIIFDMDGVIIDSERVYQEIEQEMFDELGIPVSQEEHRKFMGTAERVMWQHLKDLYGFTEEITGLVGQERKRFLEKLRSPEGIPAMEGIKELLNSLFYKGIPLLIASSSSREIIEAVILQLGIAEYFTGIVSGDDVERSKPAPDIFMKACNLVNMSPADCVVIEDSENGIRAARAAGMKVVGLIHPGSGNVDMSLADKVISRLEDFDLKQLTRIPLRK